jgi:phosphoribosylformylglycinamidine cyclo-ligase
VRKVVERTGLSWTAPAPFMSSQSIGEAILTPTRIYVKSCLAVIRETDAVKGLAHITGGGFPDNIPRILPKGLGARIDLSRVPVPPVFQWLAAEGDIAQNEMLRTFNCGIGMIAVTSPKEADAIVKAFARAGETVTMLGSITKSSGVNVAYDGKLDLG